MKIHLLNLCLSNVPIILRKQTLVYLMPFERKTRKNIQRKTVMYAQLRNTQSMQ